MMNKTEVKTEELKKEDKTVNTEPKTEEELELVTGGINMDAAIKHLVSHAHNN